MVSDTLRLLFMILVRRQSSCFFYDLKQCVLHVSCILSYKKNTLLSRELLSEFDTMFDDYGTRIISPQVLFVALLASLFQEQRSQVDGWDCHSSLIQAYRHGLFRGCHYLLYLYDAHNSCRKYTCYAQYPGR